MTYTITFYDSLFLVAFYLVCGFGIVYAMIRK